VKRWSRRLAFLAVGLLLILTVLYFVATSSAFFKTVVLPRASKALNAQITVGDASVSPFSRVALKDVQVKTTTAEPLVVVQEVRVRYSLWAILKGSVKVDELFVASPRVTLVTDAAGRSNLDPITGRPAATVQKPERPTSKPPRIDIKKVTVENAVIRLVQEHKGGGRDLTELRKANLNVTDLKNGQTGKLTLTTEMSIEQNRPAPAINGSAQAQLESSFNVGLASDLNLASLQGSSRLSVNRATGSLAEAAGVVAHLDAEITPTELKQVVLRFQKEGAELAEMVASGPLDLVRREGKVKAEIRRIDRRLLNLAGASAGFDFGGTEIRSTHELTLARGGQQIAAKGDLTAGKMSVTQKALTTPAIDVQLAYDAEMNLDGQSALIRLATLEVARNQQPLLRGNLSSPMQIAWGENASPAGDAAFHLVLTNLDLADWQAFAPELGAQGKASGMIQVTSKQAGKQIGFDLIVLVAGLSARLGSNDVRQADIAIRAAGQAVEFKRYQIDSAELRLTRHGQAALALTTSGNCDPEKKEADLQLAIDAAPVRLFDILPQPGVSLSAGDIRVRSQFRRKGGEQQATARIDLASLSGVYQEKSFRDLAASADFDLTVTGTNHVNIRHASLALAPTRLALTNAAHLQGRLDLSRTNAIEGALKLTADALDLTPYYDLFASDSKEKAKPSPAPEPAPGTKGGTNAEPPAVALPVKLLTLEADLARCYLRELAITNLQTTVRIEGSHVTIKPLQFTLNGAPVRGDIDLDLGVPGYRYAVNVTGDRIPLEPLANTFSPEYRGRAKGEVLASIAIQGAGVTGPTLRKNLTGQTSLDLTNAHIQIVGSRLKAFLIPIAAAVRAPELLDTPLNRVGFNARAAGGALDLSQLSLVSPLFTADTGGKVPIADSLQSSPLPKWPMNFSLRRSLAERIRLVPKDTPTNATYARLPEFIKVAGTLNAPKPEIDLRALAGSALEMLSEKIPGVDKKTGELLQGIGGLLNRKAGTNQPGTTSTNSPATNAPTTNVPSKPSLFDLLPKPKQ
jgi:uncharacterized protein involved in outer membrane biogenesis